MSLVRMELGVTTHVRNNWETRFNAFEKTAALALGCWASMATSWAQSVPPAVPPSADPSVILRQTPGPAVPPGSKAPDPSKPTVTSTRREPVGGAAGSEARFELKRVETNPSTLLTPEQLAAVWTPYIGKDIGLTEVRQIVKDLNDLYWNLGHFSAQASLPAQRITEGVLKITLVEGKIERLTVETQEDKVRSLAESVFGLTQGDVLQGPALQDRLARFNRGSDTRFYAALQPGKAPGTTEVVAQPEVEPRYSLLGSIHNEASDSVGRNQIDLTGYARRLLNGADRLGAVVQKGKGVVNGLLLYSLPINNVGTRLGLSMSSGSTSTVDSGLGSLKVEGRSDVKGASLTHPIPAWRDIEVDVTASVQKTETSTKIEGFSIGKSNTEQHSLAIQAAYHSVTHVVSLVATGSEVRFKGPDGGTRDAVLAYATGNWSWLLNSDWWLNTRGAAQVTPNIDVPATVKFSLGNPGDVRGYPSSVVFGDQGYYASLELHRKVRDGMDAFAFFDGGKATTKGIPDQGMQSMGLGLNATFSNRLSLSTSVARPLRNAVPEQKSVRVLARLTWQFF
jgi:hemolysin activation/secretion protein